MSRHFRALTLLLLLAACGSGYDSAPRNLNDACSILRQRPTYERAFKATQRKWGVPINVQMAFIYQESKFKSDARTPFKYVLGVLPMGRQSSAYGYSQALDATWKQYQKETRSRSAKRNNIRDASDFIGWYMTETRNRNGISLNNARHQYLAYHEGHTGYSRGTWRSKSWLVRVSQEVENRSQMYRAQLRNCRKL